MIPGFYGVVNLNKDIPRNYSRILCDEKKLLKARYKRNFFFDDSLVCLRKTNCKFLNDKVFDSTSEVFICIDGIILNSKELINKYCAKSLFDLIHIMYKKNGYMFMKELRGNFSGIIYDKIKKEVIVYTDHTGSKSLFYYYNKVNKTFIFGSSVKAVQEIMKEIGLEYTIDKKGIYYILTFGYMIGYNTLIEQIRKLGGGSELIYKLNIEKFEEVNYYKLGNKISKVESSKKKCINNFNELFDYAVNLEYSKDLEYGYNHLMTLSGGLDSRMNLLTAIKLGFNNITCINTTNKGYLDEKISKKIAYDFNCNFIFNDLIKAHFLNIDKNINFNEGLTVFSGAAAILNLLDKIKFDDFGLIHTGILGDSVVGDGHYCINKNINKANLRSKAHSEFLFDKLLWLDYNNLKSQYKDMEKFNFYNLSFNFIFNGHFIMENYSEFSSPFLLVDILDYIFRIPYNYRKNYRFYFDWIYKFNKTAIKYKWERTNSKIYNDINRMGFEKRKRNIELRLIKKCGSKYYSMVPFDYYYQKNRILKTQWDNYFNRNIYYMSLLDRELYKDMINMYKNAGTIEKIQVLTVLSAYRYFFR